MFRLVKCPRCQYKQIISSNKALSCRKCKRVTKLGNKGGIRTLFKSESEREVQLAFKSIYGEITNADFITVKR